jgi:uncharacterized Fe-S radical SAM superfamily protein PflX
MVVAPNPMAYYQQESSMWEMTRTQICCVSTAQAKRNEEDTLLYLIAGGKIEKSEKEKLCTYRCSINKRHDSIGWGNLPRTFQDAVTVTRELGVRFLWIDSICIIQPHKGCSNECGGSKDWDIESKKDGNILQFGLLYDCCFFC